MGDSNSQPVNVLCLKWGNLYGPEYTNRLYRGVKANLRRPFRFVCCTDDPTGIDAGVECVPLPENPDVLGRPWPNIFAKLCFFRPGFAELEGPTLFLDVDLLVTGPLDKFFDYRPDDFCIIYNWIERRKRLLRKVPEIGNSSCFRFNAGSEAAAKVYEVFLRDKNREDLWDILHEGSQKFQTRAMREAGTISWWPDAWVASFKRHCIPPFPLNLVFAPHRPKTASVIAFHGRPDLQEAIDGFDGEKDGRRLIHRMSRPAPWVREEWERT